jgi:TPR repeat protein
VLAGLMAYDPSPAADTFQSQCLGKAPAGIALQNHLTKAKSGNVDSMFCAGGIHLYVQKDVKKALPWLEKAANAGDKRAPLVLGILYEKGTGVAEDPAAAARWYQKGMENGNAAAIRRLAELYRLGLKAAKLYRQCADMGNDRCQLALGVQYKFGEGVP